MLVALVVLWMGSREKGMKGMQLVHGAVMGRWVSLGAWREKGG